MSLKKRRYILKTQPGRQEIKSTPTRGQPLDRTEKYLLAVLKAATRNIWGEFKEKYRNEYFDFLERLVLTRRHIHTPAKGLITSAERFLDSARNAAKHIARRQHGMGAWDYQNAAKLLQSKQSHSYNDLEKILPLTKHQLYLWKNNGRLKKEGPNGRFLTQHILESVENSKYDLLKYEYDKLIRRPRGK